MKLAKRPKLKKTSQKRLGRGYGSGKGGHTSGRGQKGQKSRGKMPLLFEGTKSRKSLIRRTPFLRGKLRNKANMNKPLIVNLNNLDVFSSGETVSVASLLKNKLLDANDALKYGVKLLGGGNISKKLKIEIPCSSSAAKKIKVRQGG